MVSKRVKAEKTVVLTNSRKFSLLGKFLYLAVGIIIGAAIVKFVTPFDREFVLPFLGGATSQRSPSYSPSPVSTVVIRQNQSHSEVWMRGYLVATLPDRSTAELMQQRLNQLLQNSNPDVSQLHLGYANGMPGVMMSSTQVFVVNKQTATQLKRSQDILAIEWMNNLRMALGTQPLTLVEAQMQMYGLAPTNAKVFGLASWYDPKLNGHLTAMGERLNQNELTAAHPSLPFNTYLKVTNRKSGEAVIVRVNDRGPFVKGRILDLSQQAARFINIETSGVASVEAVIMRKL